MKKTILILALLAFSTSVFAAGTVTQTVSKVGTNKEMRQLVFTCTGDAADGTIPDTILTQSNRDILKGYFIYRVIVENTSAQVDVTADADVYIRLTDGSGTDLLDGEGVDQLDPDTKNYLRPSSEPIFDYIALDVDNNSETSAVWTITLILVR